MSLQGYKMKLRKISVGSANKNFLFLGTNEYEYNFAAYVLSFSHRKKINLNKFRVLNWQFVRLYF